MPGKHNAGGCGCCGCSIERCSCQDSSGSELCFPIIELNISGVVANASYCANCTEWFNEDKQFDCMNSTPNTTGDGGITALNPFPSDDDDYLEWYTFDFDTTAPTSCTPPLTPTTRQKRAAVGIVRRPEVTKVCGMAWVDSGGSINGQSYYIEFSRVASEDYPCPPFSGSSVLTAGVERNDVIDAFAPCITKDMVIGITWIG